MTTAQDLLDLVVAALVNQNAASRSGYATDAGPMVFRPGDWPTQDGQYPVIKLRVPRENKQSLGRGGAPQFTVITTIRLVGEVSQPADVNNAGAAAAEAALWRLARQIEVAVINSYPLFSIIQQVATVDSQLSYNSDAETHLAGVQVDLGIEWYAGADDFAPIPLGDLSEIDVSLTTYPPAGFTAKFP